MDSLLRAVPPPAADKRVFLPHGTASNAARQLRAEGWIAIAALGPSGDDAAEARRLGCSHLYAESGLIEIQPEE
jgi:ATP phosphoribosyltransferase regulatory subunit